MLKRCTICVDEDVKKKSEGSQIHAEFNRSVWNSGDSGLGVSTNLDNIQSVGEEELSRVGGSFDAIPSPTSPISAIFQSKAAKQTKSAINNLKSVLIADDKVLLAEANELRRLKDPSTWIDRPNHPIPRISEMLEQAKLSASEKEIVSLCSEITRRVKSAISENMLLLRELIDNEFSVDGNRFKSDPAYREGVRSLHSVVRRFGSSNVKQVVADSPMTPSLLVRTNSSSHREGSFRSPLLPTKEEVREEEEEEEVGISLKHQKVDKSPSTVKMFRSPSSVASDDNSLASSSASSNDNKPTLGISVIGGRIRNTHPDDSTSPSSSFDSSSFASPRLMSRLASRTKLFGLGGGGSGGLSGSANSLIDLESREKRGSMDSYGSEAVAINVDDISRVLTERTHSAYSAADILDMNDSSVSNDTKTINSLEKDGDKDSDEEEGTDEDMDNDEVGDDEGYEEDSSIANEFSIAKLSSREQQMEALHVLPVCVFTADLNLTMAQVRKETGRPPVDQVECIRTVPKLSDRADIISRLPPPIAATILLELKLRGSYQNVYECIKAEFRAPIKQELLSGKKYVMVHKTMSQDTSLAITKCSNALDLAALLQAFENLTRATNLLLEIHRRGAATVLIQHVVTKLPICVASLLTSAPIDDRPILFKCLDPVSRCNIFSRLSYEAKIESLFAMHTKDRAYLLNNCECITKQNRNKIEKMLKTLDNKRAKQRSGVSQQNQLSSNASGGSGGGTQSVGTFGTMSSTESSSIMLNISIPKPSPFQRVFQRVLSGSESIGGSVVGGGGRVSSGGGGSSYPSSPILSGLSGRKKPPPSPLSQEALMKFSKQQERELKQRKKDQAASFNSNEPGSPGLASSQFSSSPPSVSAFLLGGTALGSKRNYSENSTDHDQGDQGEEEEDCEHARRITMTTGMDDEDDHVLLPVDSDRYAAAELLRTRSFAGDIVSESEERQAVIQSVKEEYERRTPLDPLEIQEMENLAILKATSRGLNKVQQKRLKLLKKIDKRAKRDYEKSIEGDKKKSKNKKERRDKRGGLVSKTSSFDMSVSSAESSMFDENSSEDGEDSSEGRSYDTLSPGNALRKMRDNYMANNKLNVENLSVKTGDDGERDSEFTLQNQLEMERDIFGRPLITGIPEESGASYSGSTGEPGSNNGSFDRGSNGGSGGGGSVNSANAAKLKRRASRKERGGSRSPTTPSTPNKDVKFNFITGGNTVPSSSSGGISPNGSSSDLSGTRKTNHGGKRSNASADDVLGTDNDSTMKGVKANNSRHSPVRDRIVKDKVPSSGSSITSQTNEEKEDGEEEGETAGQLYKLRAHSESAASHIWKERETQLQHQRKLIKSSSKTERSPLGHTHSERYADDDDDDANNKDNDTQDKEQEQERSSTRNPMSPTKTPPLTPSSKRSPSKNGTQVTRRVPSGTLGPGTPRYDITPNSQSNNRPAGFKRNGSTSSGSSGSAVKRTTSGSHARRSLNSSRVSLSEDRSPVTSPQLASKLRRSPSGSRVLSSGSPESSLKEKSTSYEERRESQSLSRRTESSSSSSSLRRVDSGRSQSIGRREEKSGGGGPQLRVTTTPGLRRTNSGRQNSFGSPTPSSPFERTLSNSSSIKSNSRISSPKNAPPSKSKAVANCAKGHGLRAFKTPEDGWYCSVCVIQDNNCERFKEHSTMYGCRECDYDLCKKCYKNPPKSSLWNTPLSPHGSSSKPTSSTLSREMLSQKSKSQSLQSNDTSLDDEDDDMWARGMERSSGSSVRNSGGTSSRRGSERQNSPVLHGYIDDGIDIDGNLTHYDEEDSILAIGGIGATPGSPNSPSSNEKDDQMMGDHKMQRGESYRFESSIEENDAKSRSNDITVKLNENGKIIKNKIFDSQQSEAENENWGVGLGVIRSSNLVPEISDIEKEDASGVTAQSVGFGEPPPSASLRNPKYNWLESPMSSLSANSSAKTLIRNSSFRSTDSSPLRTVMKKDDSMNSNASPSGVASLTTNHGSSSHRHDNDSSSGGGGKYLNEPILSDITDRSSGEEGATTIGGVPLRSESPSVRAGKGVVRRPSTRRQKSERGVLSPSGRNVVRNQFVEG